MRSSNTWPTIEPKQGVAVGDGISLDPGVAAAASTVDGVELGAVGVEVGVSEGLTVRVGVFVTAGVASGVGEVKTGVSVGLANTSVGGGRVGGEVNSIFGI